MNIARFVLGVLAVVLVIAIVTGLPVVLFCLVLGIR